MTYEIGDVVRDKANEMIPIVILEVKKTFFGRPQKYTVRWYDGGEFHEGTAFDHELTN